MNPPVRSVRTQERQRWGAGHDGETARICKTGPARTPSERDEKAHDDMGTRRRADELDLVTDPLPVGRAERLERIDVGTGDERRAAHGLEADEHMWLVDVGHRLRHHPVDESLDDGVTVLRTTLPFWIEHGSAPCHESPHHMHDTDGPGCITRGRHFAFERRTLLCRTGARTFLPRLPVAVASSEAPGPPVGRRLPALTLECTAERLLGLVSHATGDVVDREISRRQQILGEVHAPAGEVSDG